MSTTAKVQESIVKLVPGGGQTLAHLSDAELLTHTRRLVNSSNKLFAALLLQLGEIEARGIHRTRACASLYAYCIYELRMSEDAAARRSSAARLVKAFPPLFDAIAAGELHLTGLLMLGPHLTPENHLEVLARAKFRTKKEIAKLVRELHPLPAVPDQMEPIGPELPRAPRAPSWGEFFDALCPVYELPAGQRPSDWVDDSGERRRRKRGKNQERRSPNTMRPPRQRVANCVRSRVLSSTACNLARARSTCAWWSAPRRYSLARLPGLPWVSCTNAPCGFWSSSSKSRSLPSPNGHEARTRNRRQGRSRTRSRTRRQTRKQRQTRTRTRTRT